jgi:DNA-directed RNA polymerase specialized sigma24 family protein
MSESAAVAGSPATAQPPGFSDRTDADLFEGMALAGACIATAHAAFAEFHRRHAAYLFAVCARRYREEAEEIVAETLRRAYESAARFDRSMLVNAPASDDARQLVRAWIGRIVRWVAADHFADRKRRPQTVAPDPLWAEPARVPDATTELVAQVRGVIESLPEREQDIAWVVAHGWSPEEGQVRWSQDDLDAIAARFGLTRENLRQVRARLIRKLKTRLEPLLNGSPPAGESCPPTNLPNRNAN